MARHRVSGTGLVELLVATALGFVALAALTAAMAVGARILGGAGARGEVEDTAELALEALLFDVRRAGYDPQAAGIAPLGAAASDRLTLDADVNGDGLIDTSSAEHTTFTCNIGVGRLSRVVGRQSLPLVDGIKACAFHYLDADGKTIAPTATALDVGERQRVRLVALDVTVHHQDLRAPVVRSLAVALRTRP